MDLFTASMDIMTRSFDAMLGAPMRGMVGTVDAVNRATRRMWGQCDEGESSWESGEETSGQSSGSETQSSSSGSSASLSTDDVKLVDWWVFYTRPGAERLLASGSETLAYSTSPAVLGARVIPRAIEESGEQLTEREQDEYVKFRYEVKMRVARHRHEYDRRIADAVERIADEQRTSVRRTATKEASGEPTRRAG